MRAASFVTGGVELVDSALPAGIGLPLIGSLLSTTEEKTPDALPEAISIAERSLGGSWNAIYARVPTPDSR